MTLPPSTPAQLSATIPRDGTMPPNLTPSDASAVATRWKPAVTVAAIVARDGRFLMVEEDTPEGIRWNQPAGHLEPGESLAAAVIREVLEESAHRFEPEGVLGLYLAPGAAETYLRIAFVGQVGEALDLPLDTPIRRVFWADADTLRAHPERIRSPQVMACVEDYLSARREKRPWLPLAAVAYLVPGAANSTSDRR